MCVLWLACFVFTVCQWPHCVQLYVLCVCVCVCHGNDDKKSGEEMKGENKKALGKEREMVIVS